MGYLLHDIIQSTSDRTSPLGTLFIVAFPLTMKILQFFKPKPPQPTIESYGESTGVSPEQIQSLMEWLFASLLNAEYCGKSHLVWYDSDNPDPSLEKLIKKLIRRDEPIFLYRCGGRVISVPQDYYWRIMEEYPSMRVYQLEVRNSD